jgi:hypothetical protein
VCIKDVLAQVKDMLIICFKIGLIVNQSIHKIKEKNCF